MGEGRGSLDLRYEIYIAVPPHLAMIAVTPANSQLQILFACVKGLAAIVFFRLIVLAEHYFHT